MQHLSMVQSVVPKQSANASGGPSNELTARTSDDASFADAVLAHDQQGKATSLTDDKAQLGADKHLEKVISGKQTPDGIDLDAESLSDSAELDADALIQSPQLQLDVDSDSDTDLNLALAASHSKSDGSAFSLSKGNESPNSTFSLPRSMNDSKASADLVAGNNQPAAALNKPSGTARTMHPEGVQALQSEIKAGSPTHIGFSEQSVTSVNSSSYNHKLILQSELVSQPASGALKSLSQQKVIASGALNDAASAITLRDIIRSQNAPLSSVYTSTMATETRILADSARPPSSPALAQMSMARIVTLQAMHEKTTQIYGPEDGLSQLRTSDISGPSSQEPRAAVLLETGSIRPATVFPANMPRQIGTAMAQILSFSKPGSEIELRLHPEELGRLKMRLSITDGAVTINILAERPEIGDMLRRQIAVLSRELSSSGFEDVAFNFEEGFERQDSSNHQDSEPAKDAVSYKANLETDGELEKTEQATPLVMLYADGGIDIRL